MLAIVEENNDETGLVLAPDGIDQLDRDALRQRVRDHAAANAMSLKAVGLVAEVAESTFTAWMNGKYEGRNDAIDKKVRVWLKSEEQLARRRTALPAEIKFAHTQTATRFLAALEYAQAMPDIVLLAGGSGVGKTSSINYYKATRPNVWVLTAEPSLSSHSKMMEYLREVLNIPETSRHNVSRAVAAKLRDTRGLVIFDEIQHLTPKCIDQLRSVFDRSEVGLAFAGNLEVWGRIYGGGRKSEFAQVHSRIGMSVTVPGPTAKDIEILLDAAEVTGTKQRAALRWVGNKPGALRGLVKTLRAARMVAAGADEELTEAHIMAAWDRRTGGRDGAP